MDSITQPESVSYVAGSTDSQQQLDLYFPSGINATGLVVFIHGGAWRTGDRKNHQDFANFLTGNGLAVAVLDYRLSKQDAETGVSTPVHPVHCNDVISALEYLSHRGKKQKDIPLHGWTVVGHSVGAWLALAALYTGAKSQSPSEYPKHMPKPSQTVLDSIKTCVLVDGIYSITKLLEEYPDYEGFVAQAFLPQPMRADFSSVSLDDWKLNTQQKKFHIWHSRDDELLSFQQSVDAILLLNQILPSSRKHFKVEFPLDGVAAAIKFEGRQMLVKDRYPDLASTSSQLFSDFSVLKQGHDELLHTNIFWERVLHVARQQD